jgi:hypothetical protein
MMRVRRPKIMLGAKILLRLRMETRPKVKMNMSMMKADLRRN